MENMLFFGGLSMLTKAIPFITLPIITKMLPDVSAYGKADMFNVINSFGTSIAVVGMYDAIFREWFEYKDDIEYQKKITSTGLSIVLIVSIFVCLGIVLFRKIFSNSLFETTEYSNLINVSAFSVLFGAIQTIIAMPTRMRNRKKVFLYTGVSFPLIAFLLTLVFIKTGYTFEALVFSVFGMNIISVVVYYLLNKNDFSFFVLDIKIAKELLKIGLPLLPTFLIYWIFNSTDRIMINKFLGSNELGIYSVGAKVASLSQLIYTAFAGGWSYFAFSTMNESDQIKSNSKIFEYLGIISFLGFIIAQPFINPIFKMFFEGDYVLGEKVFSYLFLSPLILMLFQVIANQMVIKKKTYYVSLTLFIGAIFNLILNYFLIKQYGIKGSAFSNFFSYVISVIIMTIVCIKHNVMILEKKFVVVSVVLLLGICESLIFNEYSSFIYVLVLLLILFFYSKEVKNKVTNLVLKNK